MSCCPAIPCPATKEYFAVINIVMISEELTTEAADHWFLVMVEGKRKLPAGPSSEE